MKSNNIVIGRLSETNKVTESSIVNFNEAEPFLSVNWHLWPWCNYSCRFCFASFPWLNDFHKKYLTVEKGKELIKELVRNGMRKLNFVGGEPLLCPWLGEYLEFSKKLGVITSIVTNASLLKEDFLQRYSKYIDWIGLSIDSTNDRTEAMLGRGKGEHLKNILKVRRLLKKYNVKVKVNVTVTRYALEEDFTEIILKLKPDRLKFFQVLPISGINRKIEDLLITREEFERFVKRHLHLNPVAEDNEVMTGSYIMIDPLGHIFQNFDKKYTVSSSILEVGALKALQEVGFDIEKFYKRKGDYFLED